MPAVADVDLTGNRYVDGLLVEVKWAVDGLTFSFPARASYYEPGYGLGEPRSNFEALNAAQQAAARASFTSYASSADLRFAAMTETPQDHADLRLAMSDVPDTAWAYFPNTSAEGGDAWFNNSSRAFDSPSKGNYAHAIFVHEIGHALGLEHPHEGNKMPRDRDSLEYTVMSYRSFVGASINAGYTNETWGYPQSPMMYDIAALQYMYGANYGVNSGDTIYSWSPRTGEMFINGVGQGAPGANRIFVTVWDGGGVDTYNFSRYVADLEIDLRPGQWSTTSADQLAKLHRDGSERAAGTIANALLFNGDSRSLVENAKGGWGHDVIRGNTGINTLWGRDGDDRLFGLGSNDRLVGGHGDDTLLGGPGDDRLTGQDGDDLLRGGDGRDVLAGGPGQDTLAGGRDDDRLHGRDGDDLLKGGDGQDTLLGGLGDDRLTGQDGDDLLRGGGDRDTLIGGSGNDRLYGHIGNDRLHGRNGDDRLLGGAGDDLLRGGGGSDILSGDNGDDRLFGDSGNDVLLGGMGRDLLAGGPHADRFVFRDILETPPTAQRDVIRDFSRGEGDLIVLRHIDADVNTAQDDAFVFIDTQSFSGTAGELGYTATPRGHAVVHGDVDGDARDDFDIVVADNSVLSPDDFLL